MLILIFTSLYFIYTYVNYAVLCKIISFFLLQYDNHGVIYRCEANKEKATKTKGYENEQQSDV